MTRIAILRCGKLPKFVTWDIPNLDELFTEDDLLIQGFTRQGFQAAPVVWSRAGIDWDRFDIALIRSTWDYIDEPDHFLAVLARIEESSCGLINPRATVQWNINKHYLFDLKEWGLPILPTYLLSWYEPDELQSLFAAEGWQYAVIKPIVGGGSSYTTCLPSRELAAMLEDLAASRSDMDFFVQPFVDTVVNEGEWSYVFFNRQLSHVLLKKPAAGDYRVQGIYGGSVVRADANVSDLQQAEAIIARLPVEHLYARIDFVRLNGRLAIMEVEMIEPIFSFGLVPESVDRLVTAVKNSAVSR